MQEMISDLLKNCLPYKLVQLEGQTLCRWLVIDRKNFIEPFFEETISGYMEEKANSSRFKCVSSLEVIPEWADHLDCIEPTAFIFHVSRCGSTLISQLLSLLDENIVLSEVPFFDSLLRDSGILPEKTNRSQLLQAAIRFYGAKRQKKQSRVFIKTDSWHILYYSQLRAIYPTVPFILLYRDPGEVIRSQQKRRGMQAVPGMIEPSLFGFTDEVMNALSLDDYIIKVLEKYFTCFITIAKEDPLAFPVNYNEGPMAIMEKLAGIISMPINQPYIDEIRKRSLYHAKYPANVFQEEQKLTNLVFGNKDLLDLYHSLEALRVSGRVQRQNEPVQFFG